MELPWVEKYRPKTLEHMVLSDNVFKLINSYILNGSVKNTLFVGSPGTGKTSLAMILKNNIIKDESDCLIINASSDRGIGYMRDVVIPFMRMPPIKSPHKLIILEECDGITPDGWDILKNPIEASINNPNQQTKIIASSNSLDGIPEAILSRFKIVQVNSMDKKYIYDKVTEICDLEKCDIDSDLIMNVIDRYYPDLRTIINTLESSLYIDVIDFDVEKTLKTYVIKVINDLKSKTEIKDADVFKIREVSHGSNINFSKILLDVLHETDIPLSIYVILNRYLNTMSKCVCKETHFVSMICDIIITYKKIND